jgi:DNA-binding beta-propeller fold protein YncE
VPHSIVMDSKGLLYVADRTNKRVEIFDQDGKYVSQMTNAGMPYGLFMTKDDVLYVVDGSQGNDNLKIINIKDQRILGQFGGLAGPHMLSVDASGNIYIAEVRGASVKKFAKE